MNLPDQWRDAMRTLSHDMNNPLTAMGLLLDLLSSEMPTDEARADLMTVVVSTDRLAALAESLSRSARWAESGCQLGQAPQVVRVGWLLRSLAERPGLRDQVVLEPGPETSVMLNQSALQGLFLELLLAGLRVGGSARLQVSWERVGATLVVRVIPGAPHAGAVGDWSAKMLVFAAEACEAQGGTLAELEPAGWQVTLPCIDVVA